MKSKRKTRVGCADFSSIEIRDITLRTNLFIDVLFFRKNILFNDEVILFLFEITSSFFDISL